MSTIILPTINLEEIARQIADQRDAVEEELRRIANCKIVSQATMNLVVGPKSRHNPMENENES